MSLFVSAWVLIEWLRSWIFTGFPWLLLGHTLIDTPFAGIIPVFGSYGGSAVIAFIAVGIIELSSRSLIKANWRNNLYYYFYCCYICVAIHPVDITGRREKLYEHR